MTLPVKLSDIVSHLEMAADEMAVYLDKRTGDLVVLMSDDDLGFEDVDDYAEANEGREPDWLDEYDDEFKRANRCW